MQTIPPPWSYTMPAESGDRRGWGGAGNKKATFLREPTYSNQLRLRALATHQAPTMASLMAMKAQSVSRDAEEKNKAERKRNTIVLMLRFLADHGYIGSLQSLQVHINRYYMNPYVSTTRHISRLYVRSDCLLFLFPATLLSSPGTPPSSPTTTTATTTTT